VLEPLRREEDHQPRHVIQSALGTQFRITGLDNPLESAELALLLRAGALAAPISISSRSAPSGRRWVRRTSAWACSRLMIGGPGVLFMVVLYRVFGVFAVVALISTWLLLVAVMSLLSATLTLPGIAGIVLTVGMAVDANVMINARIREELRTACRRTRRSGRATTAPG
jgi:preprotein translocase subunit SecD